jgi:uncharacterized protein
MSSPSVRRRRWALVDTSAYFATIDAGERHHAAAVAIANRLSSERWRLFTTNFVLAETHALFLTRVNRAVAATVLSEIDNSPTTIVRVTAADEQRARAIISRYQDKDFSLTDAISFAVMERLGIGWAFTFDRNFAQYGWDILDS